MTESQSLLRDPEEVWIDAGRRLDGYISPSWACTTSDVERHLARESSLPVTITEERPKPARGDDDEDEEDEEEDEESRASRTVSSSTTLPLWLIEALAKDGVDITLDERASQQGSEGARTLALYSDRALNIVKANPNAVNLGALPSFFATGAAVRAAQGVSSADTTMNDILTRRLEKISEMASNIDRADVTTYTQLLSSPEKTFFEAVHGDAIALNDWREQKPLRITPSAYVTAAQDASNGDNQAKRPRTE